MACACKNKNKRYTVQLKGGLKITKSSEAEAIAYAAKNPGSTVIKPAA